MSVKRNTTPVLPIKVNLPLSDILRIEFLFKEKKMDNFPELVRKVYDLRDGPIPVKEGEDTFESFTVTCEFTAEETLRLPAGTIFMDTRVVLLNGKIPGTEIVEIEVTPTLFKEVLKI